MHEQQLQRLKSRALKHNIPKARIVNGHVFCPRCKKQICKIYYGGYAMGIEQWCSRCSKPVLLEAPPKQTICAEIEP